MVEFFVVSAAVVCNFSLSPFHLQFSFVYFVAAAVAHHHAAVYHPTVLRSASVPSFAPGGPTAASVASASQGIVAFFQFLHHY